MKIFNLQIEVDKNRIVIKVPDEFIGGKIELKITSEDKKTKSFTTLKETKKSEISNLTSNLKSTRSEDVLDSFPSWFNPDSLNDINDNIDNM